MAKRKKYELYGVPITRGGGVPLPDQLYSIVRQAILKGQWSIGEQLPSYNDLSALTGVSRTPIQEAYTRLEEDGYVERIRRKGIVVKATNPSSNRTMGSIVFAMRGTSDETGATPTFGYWNIGGILAQAEDMGFRTEVVRIDLHQKGFANRTLPGISNDIFGMISLVPKHLLAPLLGDVDIPIVYLGIDDPFSSPAVCGELFLTAQSLTERLVGFGHEKIGVFAVPGMDEKHLNQIVGGYQFEMNKAGLEPDIDLVEWSHALPAINLQHVNDFFKQFKDLTAVLCVNGDSAQKLIEVADFLGVDIPGDLSLASCQTAFMRDGRDAETLGCYYEWDLIVERCFDILLDAKSDQNTALLRQVYAPQIIEGESAGPLAVPEEEDETPVQA